MKVSKERLEEWRRRGMKVVGGPTAPDPPHAPAPDTPAKQVETKHQTIVIHEPEPEALRRSEAAALSAQSAAEQTREILKEVAAHLKSRPSASVPKPVAYRFTMKRDNYGRLVEVVATPITKE